MTVNISLYETFLQQSPKKKATKKEKLLWDSLSPERQIAILIDMNPECTCKKCRKKTMH